MSARDQQRIGFRIYKKVRRPAAELVAALAAVGVGDVSDAMQGMNVADAGIRPAYAPMRRVFGTAITVDLTPGDGFALRAAIGLASPGDVIVVNAHGETARAIMGGNVAMHMVHRGVAGLIVDGAVRDTEEFRALDFPALVRGVTPRSGSTASGWGEINVPVACGGVVVAPGDIVIGDDEGMAVVPAGWAGSVIAALGKTGHGAYQPDDIRATLARLAPDAAVPNLDKVRTAVKERNGVVFDGCYDEDGPLGSL